MNNLTEARTRTASIVSTHYLLPAMLAANTLVLLALEQLGAVPDWIKTAAALFLAF